MPMTNSCRPKRVSLERLFLSRGICNQLTFAGDRASHRLAEEEE